MRVATNGVCRYCTLPASADSCANAPGRLHGNSVRRAPPIAMSGISSTTVTGNVHISASGTRRNAADHRALVARWVAMKNIAATPTPTT